jgi:hypothetical protein
VTSVSEGIQPRRYFPDASVDQTEARWPDLVRCQFVATTRSELFGALDPKYFAEEALAYLPFADDSMPDRAAVGRGSPN